ncbi:MAG: S8 family serine peptidase [Planctomycetes bacterium]|nr:S8 family serine peptidase [Planctomycetota bacterium]
MTSASRFRVGMSAATVVALLALATTTSDGAAPGRNATPAPSAVVQAFTGPLMLRSGAVALPRGVDGDAVAAAMARPSRRLVLQVVAPLDEGQRGQLSQAGVVLGDYLPDGGYIVQLRQPQAAAIAALPFVRSLGAFADEWKLDPNLGQTATVTRSRLELRARGQALVTVTLFEHEAAEAAINEIAAAGGIVISASQAGRQWLIDAIMPLDAAPRLAAVDSVQFIEEAPDGVLRNDTNEWIVQSNLSGQTPVWNAGIHGEGQIGGLIDGTINESHCAFDDSVPVGPTHRKIIAMRNASFSDSHGTHTAGTFAGDKGTYGVRDQYDGLAFAAKISFSNVDPIFSSPSTLYARLQDAHNDGARVHSNSWGDDGTTAYTTWCRQIDLFSYDYEESLVAFAVTNLSSLKTPENAKDVLAVGASQDNPSQGSHCSGGVGPTSDGRRKPEIYAPGCGTLSASSSSSCNVVGFTGTSMACPAVSGAGLLARQYFTDGYYPTGTPTNPPVVPSGALIKALLINSGVDMTGISGYPSNLEGWGRLLLDNSLYFPGDTAKLSVEDVRNVDGLTTGGTAVYQLSVTDSAVPLRITLAFTEPPGSVNASNPVINNLDLEVTAPGAVSYKGNVFTGGQSATGGSFDAKNNVERVVLSNPPTGAYLITVRGAAVNLGTQGYGLVVTGAFTKDCNDNGVPDSDDITNGTSQDCNSNGIPDECENDCDGDLVPDACELASCPPLDPSCADCNANTVPDGCDLTAGTSADCNGNLAPDECDIAGGGSSDANGDGVPDECCPPTVAPGLEAGGMEKNRYLSIVPGNPGTSCALQLSITSNLRFPASIGLTKWVGPPDAATGIARLQCTPEYRNWGAAPTLVHIGDAEVTPGATYNVKALGNGCSDANPASFSAAATVSTTLVWGDTVGMFDGAVWTPPNAVVNFVDVQAVLQRYQGRPTAPALVRVDVDGQMPNAVVNFADIQRAIQAFLGAGYPYDPPTPCP